MGWRRRQTRALTMIEVLVALGIATVLIGFTVPVISRVRESGRATLCLNNLRQLGAAFISYATDNNGRFPRPGALNPPPSPWLVSEDWIHWLVGFDPDNGALVPYMGGTFIPARYTCPSDDPQMHPNFLSGRYYAYSYSVNEMICCAVVHQGRPVVLSAIQSPSEKILLIDEAGETIDDGCWAWQEYKGGDFNILSNRHRYKTDDVASKETGEGHVCYVDGHAGVLSRKESFTPHNYDPSVK